MLSLFGSDSDGNEPAEPRLHGLVRGVVIDNLDLTSTGRVQVRIPTMPGIEPWADVCAPVAGDGRGVWCIPQPDDVVLIGFENGDVTHPIVLGGLWDFTSRPPVDIPSEATTKRVVRTPAGHEFVLDDLAQSLTLKHALGHVLEISADGITLELAEGQAALTLGVGGTVELKGTAQISISAPDVSADADAALALSGGTASLQASGTCDVKGSLVTIN